MKLKLKEGLHEVDYHGISVIKMIDHPFLATDQNGRVYPYKHPPEPIVSAWRGDGGIVSLAKIDLGDNDWRDTLVEYDADGNVVKPKRRFMIRGKVVEQPSPEREWVVINSAGCCVWHYDLLAASNMFNFGEVASVVHIDDLQEVSE